MPGVPSPVVSTQWLADYLGSDRLVVVDASAVPYVQPNGRPGYLSGEELFLTEGHIAGAVFADLITALSAEGARLPFTRPDAERFERAAAALGIDNETTVIVYDRAVGQWASRLWWLFRSFGFDRVAVLDGGLPKWLAEEREVEVGHVVPRSGATFVAVERPELWADAAEVEAIVAGTAPGALVCGLPPREFSGEEGPRARLGHIPGSLSVPAGRLVDRASNALLGTDELAAAFAPIAGSERIVTYCAAGIAGAADALALTLLGHTNVALYDGSLNEWVADESHAVVTV